MADNDRNIDDLFQDAFESFESTPRPSIWEQIAEETAFDAQFKQSFDDFEATPNPAVWEAIAGPVAFDAQLQASFSSFAVTPNPSIWEQMDQQLSFDEQIRATISGVEVQPNPEVWLAVASHPFEAHVRRSLKDYEVAPADSNWDNIKRRIPFTIFLRHNVQQISRIAAILVVGLLLALGLGDFSWENNHGVATNSPTIGEEQPQSIACLETKPNVKNTPEIVAAKTKEIIPTYNLSETASTAAAIPSLPRANRTKEVVNISPITVPSSPVLANNNLNTAPPSVNNTVAPINKNEPASNFVAAAPSSKERQNTLLVNEIPGKESFVPIDGIKMTLQQKNMKARNEQPSSGNRIASAFGEGEIDDIYADVEEIIRNNKLVGWTDDFQTIEKLNYRGIYIIASGQYGFNWLYNEGVREQLSEIVTTDYQIDFGGSLGVGLGFMFSPRAGIEAQWNYTKINQSYREHVPDGLFLDTKTSLTYSSFPVLLKVQLNRLKNNRRVPMTTSVALGGQYRYLRNSNVQANVEVERSQFIEKEIGAIVGYDVNLHLNKHIFLTIGGRASVGTDVNNLSNLSKDGRFNTEVGLRMALNYRLK